MTPETNWQRRAGSFPLRAHLAIAFLLLASVVGAVTIYHTYRAGADLVFQAGEETFTHAARETSQQVRELLAPAKLQLDLAARHIVGVATTRSERLAAAPFLAAALDDNANLVAVRVGYETGDLLQLRRASGTVDSQAPADAAYVVDDLEQSADVPISSRLVLGRDFGVLHRTAVAGAARDPRHQPWFHQATAASGVMRTDMNMLSTGAIGTTLSRRTPSGESVVALDIALDTLSARFRRTASPPPRRSR